MQISWVLKCKNDTNKLYRYIMCFFYLWFVDVKYLQFTFKLNMCDYRDVILLKTMWFLYKPMNTKICTKFAQTYEADKFAMWNLIFYFIYVWN
jgi:hypothetical protein